MCLSTEKQLVKYLLESYAKAGIIGRPVSNTTETLKILFGVSLVQILSLNEKDQVLTTNIWCSYVSSICVIDPSELLLEAYNSKVLGRIQGRSIVPSGEENRND